MHNGFFQKRLASHCAFCRGGGLYNRAYTCLLYTSPSGVSYCDLRPEHMTVVDLSGNVIEGEYAPAADMPAHLELYKAFPNCGGIVRTHSSWATAFAQACKPIPPFGTIHADHFYGEIPATRLMTKTEIENSYEKNIGLIIIEAFKNLDPEAVPGVLVSGHGPWSWGSSPVSYTHLKLSVQIRHFFYNDSVFSDI